MMRSPSKNHGKDSISAKGSQFKKNYRIVKKNTIFVKGLQKKHDFRQMIAEKMRISSKDGREEIGFCQKMAEKMHIS